MRSCCILLALSQAAAFSLGAAPRAAPVLRRAPAGVMVLDKFRARFANQGEEVAKPAPKAAPSKSKQGEPMISAVDKVLVQFGMKKEEECELVDADAPDLMEQIKCSGRAGIVSYVIWEWIFWLTAIPIACARHQSPQPCPLLPLPSHSRLCPRLAPTPARLGASACRACLPLPRTQLHTQQIGGSPGADTDTADAYARPGTQVLYVLHCHGCVARPLQQRGPGQGRRLRLRLRQHRSVRGAPPRRPRPVNHTVGRRQHCAAEIALYIVSRRVLLRTAPGTF